jgi:hypothetical protein
MRRTPQLGKNYSSIKFLIKIFSVVKMFLTRGLYAWDKIRDVFFYFSPKGVESLLPGLQGLAAPKGFCSHEMIISFYKFIS